MRGGTVRAVVVAVALALGSTGCVPGGSDAGQDDPVGETVDGQGEAQQVAAAYVGLPEDEALDLAADRGDVARVGTADDVGQPGQSDDYQLGRLTFVVTDGVVAEVIVETEAGPKTVAAS